MDFLLIFLLALAIITIVGHLLWRFIAMIFGFRVQTVRRNRPRPSVGEDRVGMEAQLDRLVALRLIDAATRERVRAAMHVQQKIEASGSLFSRSPTASPPPLPAIPLEMPNVPPPLPSVEAGAANTNQSTIEHIAAIDESELVPIAPSPLPAETATTAPPPPRRPLPVPKPRRTFAEVFAAFMEDRNIRWGELLGGLLIVGCSIALVISFWGEIAQRPVFKFSLFTAVTAALFGLGLYSEHRWKLPTTSRGILLIATLLVPLNFMAFAAMSTGASPGALASGAEIAALALFTFFVWQAAKVLAPAWPANLTAGVAALSACVLAMRAVIPSHPAASHLALVALLPAGCYGAGCGWMLWIARRWRSIRPAGANAMLLLLGVLSFAAALAMELLVTATDVSSALKWTAPVLSLCGLPALATGMLVWQRTASRNLARQRLAGTSVAFLGALVMLSGVALAWPNPATMLPVAVCNFLAFTAIAILQRAPAAHWLALPCLVLTWLLGFSLISRHVGWEAGSEQLFAALSHPANGTALAPLALLIGIASAGYRRMGRNEDSRVYLRFVWVPLVLSLVLLNARGFGTPRDPFGAAWVYAIYAILAFAIAWRRQSGAAGAIGWALAVAAFAQAFVAHQIGRDPWLTALLACALLAAGFAALMSSRQQAATLLLIPARYIELVAASVLTLVALFDILPGLQFEFGTWPLNSPLPAHLALHGFDPATWLLVFAVAVLVALDALRNRARLTIYALVLTAWAACPLLAARYTDARMTASMFRWAAACFLIFAFIADGVIKPQLSEGVTEQSVRTRHALWGTLLALAILPIVLLTALGLASALSDGKLPTTAGHVWLAHISPGASYAMPLVFVALVLAAYGLRKRETVYGPAASFFGCLAFSAGYLMYSFSVPTGRDFGMDLMRLVEGNAMVLCAVALGWLMLLRLRGGSGEVQLPASIEIQASIAAWLVGILLAFMTCAVVAWPTSPIAASAGADVWGFAAVGLAILGIWGPKLVVHDALRIRHIALPLLMLASIAACIASTWNRLSSPIGFNTLLAGNVIAAWLIFGFGAWIAERRAFLVVVEDSFAPEGQQIQLNYQRPPLTTHQRIVARGAVKFGEQLLVPAVRRWSGFIGAIAVLLSLIRAVEGAHADWWAVPATMSIAILFAMLAWWAWQPQLLYRAALLTTIGVDLFYLLFFSPSHWAWGQFLCVNVMAIALPGIAWLVLELQIFRRGGLLSRQRLPAHRAAGVAALAIFACITLIGFGGASMNNRIDLDPIYALAAIGSLVALMIASLWDAESRDTPGALYAIGLMSIALWLETVPLDSRGLVFRACCDLAGFGLLAALIFALRHQLIALARQVGVPVEGRDLALDWLPLLQACVAAAVVTLAFWCDFLFAEAWVRWSAAAAALSQALAFVLLAYRTSSSTPRQLALILAAVAAAAIGWAGLRPEPLVLERCVAVFVAWTVVDVLYVLALPQVLSEGNLWRSAARSVAVPVAIAAALALFLTLGVEVAFMLAWVRVPMTGGAIAIVLITLLGASATSLWLAVRKLSLPQRQRINCVYAAEGLLALAFAHARLTMPFLFGGIFAAYWPLVVMVIAFIGVGAGEALRQRGNRILSEPLARTGVFLPLLPVMAFWMLPARVDLGLLLLVVCVFYSLVAALRRSFTFAIVAALAGNGALWHLLAHSPGWAFFQHPQVWLIPIALSILVAAQLNRQRLNREQLSLLRYGCLIVVYVSSTADVFLNGVATAPWLPLVLAALSVAGVMVGLLLHIRPFLYLGTAFLTLSVVTMIYYASSQLHWTWIWYVAGILLGAAIITLFALFERKRTEMMAMMAGLKQWQ